MTLHEFAEEILMFRARHRLSQIEMAKQCGVSPQTIHLIETEQQEPTKITIAKIKLGMKGDAHES